MEEVVLLEPSLTNVQKDLLERLLSDVQGWNGQWRIHYA